MTRAERARGRHERRRVDAGSFAHGALLQARGGTGAAARASGRLKGKVVHRCGVSPWCRAPTRTPANQPSQQKAATGRSQDV